MAINYICKFLQFDLSTLFCSNVMVETELQVDSNLPNIIEYDYGSKLKIYRGKPIKRRRSYRNFNMNDNNNSETDDDDVIILKMDNDSDSIDNCSIDDVSSTQEPSISSSRIGQPTNCDSNSTLWNWFQHLFTINSNRSPQNVIEERAQILYQNLQFKNSKTANWWNLENWRKLEFYWAALSNEGLSEEPLENFKRFYSSNMPQGRKIAKKYNEDLLIAWHSLSTKKKLPFIMEAFMAKVSAGKVNFSDERELQKMIQYLQSKC